MRDDIGGLDTEYEAPWSCTYALKQTGESFVSSLLWRSLGNVVFQLKVDVVFQLKDSRPLRRFHCVPITQDRTGNCCMWVE